MNLSELKELFDLITERNITEFELERDGVKVKVKKGVVTVNGAETLVENAPVARAEPEASAAVAGVPEPAPLAAPASATLDEGLTVVKSPMVGTFYRQSAPGAEPFAAIGDRIKKGQVLCIIEAMKLMNEIESELQGELVEVFVEDGQPVGFGERLFAIRES